MKTVLGIYDAACHVACWIFSKLQFGFVILVFFLTLTSLAHSDEVQDLLDLFSANQNASSIPTLGLTDNHVLPIGTLQIDTDGGVDDIVIETLKIGLGSGFTDITDPQRVETIAGTLAISIPANTIVLRGSTNIVNNVPFLNKGGIRTTGSFSNGLGGLIIDEGNSSIEAESYSNAGRVIVMSGPVSSVILTNDFSNSSTGSLEIDSGGSFSLTGSRFINLGGSATINGGSLTNAGDLELSDGGSFDILNGGSAVNEDVDIGELPNGSSSSASVRDSGSIWTISADLNVGDRNAGTLTISSGGKVTSDRGFVGRIIGSTGAAIVNGSGSRWTNTAKLLVGGAGDGSLSISNGGRVSNTDLATVGNINGISGTVTVDGQNSLWSNSGTVQIGGSGNGTLTISNGGTVTNTEAFISSGSNSVSSATVSGTASRWTNSGDLSVGKRGTATVTISNGGTVTNVGGRIGDNNGSFGSMIVTGAGSTWTNSTFLNVGNGGDGTLDVLAGGVVNSDTGFIGQDAVSTGMATVDGMGSRWNMTGDFDVGDFGDGTLTISNGGTVTDVGGRIGNNGGSVGRATVTGTGSTWTNSNFLDVGNDGDGTLDVLDGGVVNSDRGFIGQDAASTGVATVDGVGSRWNMTGDFDVGDFGDGILTISNGGTVTDVGGRIGNNGGSVGRATVTGTGSTWTNSNFLDVGNDGDGTLDVLAGGVVNSDRGFIGQDAASTGIATVDGVGSRWNLTGDFDVGDFGTGTLNITGGAVVDVSNSAKTFVGHETSSVGITLVDGPGSTLTSSDSLYIGGNDTTNGGTGTVTIKNDGNITVANDVKLWSNGTLNLEGGKLRAGSLDPAAGTFNWTGGTLAVDNYSGSLTQSTGTLAAGDSAGSTDINGDYTLNNGGTIEIELADPGGVRGVDFDAYDANGTATLAGLMDVNFIDGYLGALGESFDVLTAASIDTTGLTVSESFYDISIVPGGNGSILRLTLNTQIAFDWDNNSGGDFQTDANWSQAGLPGVVQVARFDSPGEAFTTTFSADIETSRATFRNGDVSLDLSGQTYTLSSPNTDAPSLNVGEVSGDIATLTLTNGAINAQHISIGENGSTGGLTVGAGAMAAGSSTVLGSGGTLTIAGGTLTTGSFDDSAGGTFNFDEGELVIDGGTFNQGTVDLMFEGSTPGSNPTLTFQNGASQTNVQLVGVGDTNQGTLKITDGASIAGTTGRLGIQSGSIGTVNVEGASSTWVSTGDLFIGDAGSGTLFISDGGTVTNVGGRIGENSGSTGAVTVTGAGSTWTNSNFLDVGNDGDGTLDVLNGGVVNTDRGFIGQDAASISVAKVDGSGSQWNLTADLRVGDFGDGTLIVSGGGLVTNVGGLIGEQAGSTGAVTVTGTGSTWTSSNFLDVGNDGDGTLDVNDGGVVNSDRGFIGQDAASISMATVDGTGSQWNLTGEFNVGDSGTGTLNITAGGSVDVSNSAPSMIATESGSTGIVTVDGNGSKWTNSGSLYVGGNATQNGGMGTLTISNNGEVTVAGTTKIRSNDDTLTISGGTLATGSIENTGGGTFNFDDGTLRVGSFLGDLTQDGGTLEVVGNSAGTINVSGDYQINAGALSLEILSDGSGSPVPGVDFDQLTADTVSLADTLELLVDPGYAPTLGDRFPIVTASVGVSGTFSTVFGAYLGGGLGLDIQYNANDVTLEVVNVLLGDFDVDGDVDGDDLSVSASGWESRYGIDFDGSDFLAWQRNFGLVAPLAASSASVPEPTSLLLTTFAACGLLMRRPARSRAPSKYQLSK